MGGFSGFSKSIILLLGILCLGFSTLTGDPAEHHWRKIEAQVETDPAAALQSLRELEKEPDTKSARHRHIRYLKGRALFQLERYAEAEKILGPLMEEMTADSGADPLLLSRAALALGKTLNRLSRPAEGEAALTVAQRHLSPDAPPELRGEVMIELARNSIYQGKPVNAADWATRALEWAAPHGLSEHAVQGRYLLAYAYRNQNRNEEARRHFRQVREEAARSGNLRYQVLAMNELGNLLVAEERMDAALAMKQRALDLALHSGDPYLKYVCRHDIGHAYISAGRFPEALEIFREVLGSETARVNHRARAMVQNNIGYVLSQLNRPEEAREFILRALQTARERQLGEVEVPILEELIRQLEETGRTAEALVRQKELTALQQQIAERELERKITEVRDRHRLLDQETEIRILRQEKEIRGLQLDRQRIVLFSVVGLAVFLALMAVFALAGYRAKRQANHRLEDLNRRLDDLSRTDPLTGLSNRRDLLEKLRLLKARADRGTAALSLLMIDLDHFKGVNDRRGHATGDQVLQRVAKVLRQRIRAQDLLARWGGEEFLVALADTDLKGARQAAEQFRAAVEAANFSSGAAGIPVTVTVGVSRYRKGEELTAAITRADDLLYAGKKKGRNRVEG